MMSQRNSGYARKERDLYETPTWCTEVLVPHLPPVEDGFLWEPACGSGKMVMALQSAFPGIEVWGSDIEPGEGYCSVDFFAQGRPRCSIDRIMGIITNPPYRIAQQFIERGLKLSECTNGFVAMLLRIDFDSAKTRRHLFADNPAWSKKIILTDRIKWFEGAANPSFNHAWFVWDWKHEGPANIHYAGKDSQCQ